jgi:hypothetical protein
MSSNVVNLHKVRKVKERADKKRRAEENRAKFGRTKAEREVDKRRRSVARELLDAHRRTGCENEET